mmetsp:Transcript_16157/g.35083  ORF Transcript_16157/g.35083 Transcript_16157/m.35083 type:complete len:139 (-) Transcript_16157:287-703(-)
MQTTGKSVEVQIGDELDGPLLVMLLTHFCGDVTFPEFPQRYFGLFFVSRRCCLSDGLATIRRRSGRGLQGNQLIEGGAATNPITFKLSDVGVEFAGSAPYWRRLLTSGSDISGLGRELRSTKVRVPMVLDIILSSSRK